MSDAYTTGYDTLSPEQAAHIEVPRDRYWSFGQRLMFRFAFVYFVLHILPFPLNHIDYLAPVESVAEAVVNWVLWPYHHFWDAIVLWTGQRVFSTEITSRPGGSGDTTWNYVQVFCFAIIAAATTILWSVVDWKRPNYTRLHEWLRVYVRFYLAATLIHYGAAKVIKTQFPDPSVERLLLPYGESSPMRLLWTFMGVSGPYNIFTGAGEMLGGLLLCTRRTTLLGALVTIGVMTHVAALNYCYDVPVKLLSTHLVVMAVFLVIPSVGWLADVFILGRRSQSPGVAPLTASKRLNRCLVAIRTVVVIVYVSMCLYSGHQRHAYLSSKPPFYGAWEVDEFTADGEVRPPLMTDAARWHVVSFGRQWQSTAAFAIQSMTGERSDYWVSVDTENGVLSLTPPTERSDTESSDTPEVLVYRQPELGRLIIDGKLGGRQVSAKLRRIDESEFILINRGFHWINETGYNEAVPRQQRRTD